MMPIGALGIVLAGHFLVLTLVLAGLSLQSSHSLTFSAVPANINILESFVVQNIEMNSQHPEPPSTEFIPKDSEPDQSSTAKILTTKTAPSAIPTANSNTSQISHPSARSIHSAQSPSSLPTLSNPHPPYPRQSRRMGEQGQVVVAVEIKNDGTVVQAHIKQSSGYKRLDASALETVMRWRFIPTTNSAQQQKSWINIPINFVLN
jgi:periplasmic protein TonB